MLVHEGSVQLLPSAVKLCIGVLRNIAALWEVYRSLRQVSTLYYRSSERTIVTREEYDFYIVLVCAHKLLIPPLHIFVKCWSGESRSSFNYLLSNCISVCFTNCDMLSDMNSLESNVERIHPHEASDHCATQKINCTTQSHKALCRVAKSRRLEPKLTHLFTTGLSDPSYSYIEHHIKCFPGAL